MIVIVAVRHGRSRPYLDNPFVFPSILSISWSRPYSLTSPAYSPTHYSPTHRRAHPSARSLESHHHLTHRPVYLCILISSRMFLTLILIHETILFLSFYHIHLITPSYNCIVYHPHPHQSFLYIRNTEICSHGIFSSLSLSFSFLSVSSRLCLSLFRFIFTHTYYYLTSFVVSARIVALRGLFVYTGYICTYNTLID